MKKFSWIAIGILTSSCSVHPLPDQVTRQSTLAIVTAIRCEAREAILKYAPSRAYDNSAIGFVFDFDISEHNNAGLGLNFKQPFSAGSFELALANGNSDLKREAHRRFTLVDTFAELKRAKCSQEILQSRFEYPIAGSVGLHEVIETAIGIDNLANLEKGGDQVGGQTAVFSDDLTYTTTFDSGGISSTLELNAVPGVFRLTRVSASLAADRTDTHKLTLAIALPEPKAPKVGLRAAARTVKIEQGVMFTRGVPSKVLINSTADPRLRVLWELDRRILLNQDDRLINALGIRR